MVFMAGIAVGWLLANLRRNKEGVQEALQAAAQLSSLPAGTGLKLGTRGVTKTRVMEVKCTCGSLLKFRDPVADGYQPFPSGDQFACSSCGKTYDLQEIRKLKSGAQT